VQGKGKRKGEKKLLPRLKFEWETGDEREESEKW
jgi:hypothetical protein